MMLDMATRTAGGLGGPCVTTGPLNVAKYSQDSSSAGIPVRSRSERVIISWSSAEAFRLLELHVVSGTVSLPGFI